MSKEKLTTEQYIEKFLEDKESFHFAIYRFLERGIDFVRDWFRKSQSWDYTDDGFEQILDILNESALRFKIKKTEYRQWWQCDCGKYTAVGFHEEKRDIRKVDIYSYDRKPIYDWHQCCRTCGRDCKTWKLVSCFEAILVETIKTKKRFLGIPRNSIKEKEHNLGLELSNQPQYDPNQEVSLFLTSGGFTVKRPKDNDSVIDSFVVDKKIAGILCDCTEVNWIDFLERKTHEKEVQKEKEILRDVQTAQDEKSKKMES